jgi:hypothetical protein
MSGCEQSQPQQALCNSESLAASLQEWSSAGR